MCEQLLKKRLSLEPCRDLSTPVDVSGELERSHRFIDIIVYIIFHYEKEKVSYF